MAPASKSDIIKKMLVEYPKMPHRQLARMIYKKYKDSFTSEETVRTRIRYYTGCQGTSHRAKIAPENIRPPEVGAALIGNPYGLPEEHNDAWAPMRFPIQTGKGLCLFDLHYPYHSIRAITLAIQYGHDTGCKDFVFLGGDIHDNADLSKFDKDPEVRKYKEELDGLKIFLDVIQREFPKAKIIYKKGNHEVRTDHFLRRKAPELWGLKKFIWEGYLGLEERGIISVEADIPLTIGKLNIIHGHELRGCSTAVNPARGVYLKSMECMMAGHFHKTSMHTETSFSRRLDTTWSVGCLCNLSPEWMRVNKWNQGFASLDIDGDDFTIQNERIIEGMMVR